MGCVGLIAVGIIITNLVTLQNRGAWLKEGDEEIVDLMDSSAMKNISTTDPEKYKEKLAKKLTPRQAAEKAGFKVSEDGKLIITKDMLEKDEPRKYERRDTLESSSVIVLIYIYIIQYTYIFMYL